ncbi:putative ribonucleoside-diphosphate reductase [Medicago truncatula]|uniref:Putative ribonucleoside-diphosphate reductase n=1 Tax=Medicago truncatula TaxID=3880 RepID=A0A396GPT1_MEDTR|nr:putative ribonucleoside-diphosphate reductase [Medicago truncatula]
MDDTENEDDGTKMAQMVCSLTNRDECLACGSLNYSLVDLHLLA